MILNADILQGFVGSVLSSKFDDAVKTPDFHREGWELFTGKDKMVALAAPRGHAKTTGMTVSYGLATLLFRERKFMLLVSDTESQAAMFLGYFKEQLQENQALIELFGLKRDDKGIVRFVKDTETDIIVEFEDGHKFRVIAKGAEQKLRGLIWSGSRPDIILCHEKGTEIYTPETGWIENTKFPGAQVLRTEEAYKITYEDGTTEIVSGDHRFLVENEWKFPWEMKSGDNVNESISEDTLNAILKNEKNLLKSITINQRLKNVFVRGMRRILIGLLILDTSGMSKITKRLVRVPVSMLLKTLLGKLHIVPNVEVENSKPCLLGLPRVN